MKKQTKKYVRITFSSGACYDLSIDDIKKHYARFVVQQIDNRPLEYAIQEADRYFAEDEDHFIDYATFGMSWTDAVLNAISVERGAYVNKNNEWQSAKKELIER